ncbi:hypothetical protein ACLOJK_001523, partial [Asimina triloba]
GQGDGDDLPVEKVLDGRLGNAGMLPPSIAWIWRGNRISVIRHGEWIIWACCWTAWACCDGDEEVAGWVRRDAGGAAGRRCG